MPLRSRTGTPDQLPAQGSEYSYFKSWTSKASSPKSKARRTRGTKESSSADDSPSTPAPSQRVAQLSQKTDPQEAYRGRQDLSFRPLCQEPGNFELSRALAAPCSSSTTPSQRHVYSDTLLSRESSESSLTNRAKVILRRSIVRSSSEEKKASGHRIAPERSKSEQTTVTTALLAIDDTHHSSAVAYVSHAAVQESGARIESLYDQHLYSPMGEAVAGAASKIQDVGLSKSGTGNRNAWSTSRAERIDKPFTPVPVFRPHQGFEPILEDSEQEAREGLYCRTRRRLGLKCGPVVQVKRINSTGNAPHNKTGALLEQVSGVLEGVSQLKKTASGRSGDLMTARSSISMAASSPRRDGIFSRRRLSSATSSIRSLLMGKVPLPTPNSLMLYEGADNEKHMRVEISMADAPDFLPSEARRLGTPPLSPGRGFFFDQQSLQDDSSSAVRSVRSRTSMLGEEGEGDPLINLSSKNFAFNLPEHLPSSPLCPMNPKHPSMGMGVCVYHGRRKAESTP